MNRQKEGLTDRFTNGQLNGLTDGLTHGRKYGYGYGYVRTDRHKTGQTDRLTFGLGKAFIKWNKNNFKNSNFDSPI